MVDCLVTIQNNAFFHWQIELLIESFRLHNLEESLAIAVIPDKRPLYKNFTKNLRSHKRTFEFNPHPNAYLPINQCYAAYVALKTGFIKQPFVLLHSDTILTQPFREINDKICFSTNPTFISKLRSEECLIDLYLTEFAKQKKQYIVALPVGGSYQFNDVELDFFERVMYRTIELLNFWDASKHPYVNQAAWMLTFLEYHGENRNVRGTLTEVPLSEDLINDTKIIHYANGLGAAFTKSMFKYNTINFSFADNPFDLLLREENNVTSATNYLRKVIQSYLRR